MMLATFLRRALAVCALPVLVWAQPVPAFNPAPLVKLGDSVRYGSYKIIKIGDGIFQINDPGVTTGKGGAWGVDMYLVRGATKALLVDLGNNYINGYEKDVIAPRANAAEELRAVVAGLAGKLHVDAVITHAHPDHDGMSGALIGSKNVTLWLPEGEDSNAPKTQHGIDVAAYKRFATGTQTFDLGGGRVVETYLVRGHSTGGTVYLLRKDMMLFTGDALGSGFGQAFARVEALQTAAGDFQKLVDAIMSTTAPYERYALRVYTGHSWQNNYGGFMHPNHERMDAAFLDWRFVQSVASCARGILKGSWMVDGSGLQYVGKMAYTDAWPTAKDRAIMVYGTGTIIIPLEIAYQAAGVKPPQQD